jgi:hypothetical protein
VTQILRPNFKRNPNAGFAFLFHFAAALTGRFPFVFFLREFGLELLLESKK